MPTLVDSLIVELGLDPTKFKKGVAEAGEAVKKAKEEHLRAGKEMESAGERAAEFYRKIRNEVVALFAVFTAGKGLKEFISYLNEADVAVGDLSRQMNLAAGTLSSWQGAARASGNSAQGVTATMMHLTQELQKFALTGESDVVPYFRALGIGITDANFHLKTADQLLLQLSDRVQGMDPARAHFFLQAIGADQGTINLLMLGRKELEGLLAAEEKLKPTPDDLRAAGERVRSFALLDDTLTSVGRTILTTVTPAMVAVADAVREWVGANRELIAQRVDELVKEFAGWLRSIDWNAIKQGLEDFWRGVTQVVDSLGGWKTVGEIILGLWAADKLAPTIMAISALFQAIAVGATMAMGPVGALAAMIGVLALPDEVRRGIGSKVFGKVFGEGEVERFTQEFSNAPGESVAAKLWNYMRGNRGPSTGPTPGEAEQEGYIRDSARRHGIDPNIAVEVARREGLHGYVGDRGSSFGPYQLHYGGMAGGGMAVGGLGDEFTRQTGLSAMDPSTWREQVDFAMAHAATHGWGAWHGWTGTPWAGIGAMGGPEPGFGVTNNAGDVTTVHTRVGTINVHTQATDAEGIARDIGKAIEANSYAAQADGGPN
jgi:hypothetical protein